MQKLTKLVTTHEVEIREGNSTNFHDGIRRKGFDLDLGDFVEAQRMLVILSQEGITGINVSIADAYIQYCIERGVERDVAYEELRGFLREVRASDYLPKEAKLSLASIG